jgi:Protein of unknown function (DUF3592)
MTPTSENIKVFVALCLGIALLLSGLLFVFETISGRRIKWGGFIVFALAAYGLPIVGFASKYAGDRNSLRNETTTSGVVAAHDVPNHNQYQFEYAISGQRYYGWHQGAVTCDTGELYVGKTVLVYYDPTHPEKADLCSFRGAISNDLQILTLLSGMLAVTAVFTRIKQKRKKSQRLREDDFYRGRAAKS